MRKAAFTGAEKTRHGRFEMASGGTLFLDEIGDVPLPLQAKLLRAIETKRIQRVGGGKDIPIDLRLIYATHQNIEADIEAGKFCADLFYQHQCFRSNCQHLPNGRLTSRRSSQRFAVQLRRKATFLACRNLTIRRCRNLARYPWPGNVRELRNVIERACLLFPGKVIDEEGARTFVALARARSQR